MQVCDDEKTLYNDDNLLFPMSAHDVAWKNNLLWSQQDLIRIPEKI